MAEMGYLKVVGACSGGLASLDFECRVSRGDLLQG